MATNTLVNSVATALNQAFAQVVNAVIVPWLSSQAGIAVTGAALSYIQAILIVVAGYGVYVLQGLSSSLTVFNSSGVLSALNVQSTTANTGSITSSSIRTPPTFVTQGNTTIDTSKTNQILLSDVSQTISLPNLDAAQSGRLISFANAGLGTFTIQSAAKEYILRPGKSGLFLWTGSSWENMMNGFSFL
jgi:hypothetical protein